MRIVKTPKITIEGNLHLSRVVALLDFINKNQYLKSSSWLISENQVNGNIHALDENSFRTFVAIEDGYSSIYQITIKEFYFSPYSRLEFFDDEISDIYHTTYENMLDDDKTYFNQCLDQMISEKATHYQVAQEIIDKIDALTSY